jgi:hypothetical protein
MISNTFNFLLTLKNRPLLWRTVYMYILYRCYMFRCHAVLGVSPEHFVKPYSCAGGHAVAQLVESLHYKPEGGGFDSQLCHGNFSLTLPFRPHYGPGVDSAPNRNEYQVYFLGDKGGRCIRPTTLPPSCADCLDILEPQPPGTLRVCPGL